MIKLLCCTLLVFALSCQNRNPPTYTISGPEATDLAPRMRGWIAITEPVGGIQIIRLPELDATMRREPGMDKLPVHSVAGPDHLGRVAFVENNMTKKWHALAMLEADGNERQIFEAEGDALWGHAAGEYLALNPAGSLVAIVARAKGGQGYSPDAYLMEGELEVWDTFTNERLLPPILAYDDVMSWFPDGKRLAYSAFVEADEAAKLLRTHVSPEDPFGSETRSWKKVPVVHVLDTETGQSAALHVGQRPLVSPDGNLVLMRDFALHWRILDLESHQSSAFEAPGAIYPGAVAFADSHAVLYWAWPTEGAEIQFTVSNSPLAGPKQMRALKLVDLRDGRFQTVVPFVDPRCSVSFGSSLR